MRDRSPAHDLSTAAWRKSSFSNATGSCVEIAPLDNGRIAVRNSNHPDACVVLFTRAEIDAYLKGVKAGEFDDFTGD